MKIHYNNNIAHVRQTEHKYKRQVMKATNLQINAETIFEFSYKCPFIAEHQVMLCREVVKFDKSQLTLNNRLNQLFLPCFLISPKVTQQQSPISQHTIANFQPIKENRTEIAHLLDGQVYKLIYCAAQL